MYYYLREPVMRAGARTLLNKSFSVIELPTFSKLFDEPEFPLIIDIPALTYT
jgi:hypothetical protein